MKFSYSKIKHWYNWGGRYLTNSYNKDGAAKSIQEIDKPIKRFEIINHLISTLDRPITYLEIGVRNPDHNFNKINAETKYSVDPGLEFKANPVDFQMTSDEFFSKLDKGEVLKADLKFDIIFIDGLHLADQTYRDIVNSLKYIKEDGFIVMHDCNPPTEYHAREEYDYDLSPARSYWNGTTWKAFVKATESKDYSYCCIDTDWGVGILSMKADLGSTKSVNNPFYEYKVFEANRAESLNLISFDQLKKRT